MQICFWSLYGQTHTHTYVYAYTWSTHNHKRVYTCMHIHSHTRTLIPTCTEVSLYTPPSIVSQRYVHITSLASHGRWVAWTKSNYKMCGTGKSLSLSLSLSLYLFLSSSLCLCLSMSLSIYLSLPPSLSLFFRFYLDNKNHAWVHTSSDREKKLLAQQTSCRTPRGTMLWRKSLHHNFLCNVLLPFHVILLSFLLSLLRE